MKNIIKITLVITMLAVTLVGCECNDWYGYYWEDSTQVTHLNM